MSEELIKGIEGIIFDFGEVLIELDYPKVIEGFSNVAQKNSSEIKEMVVTALVLQEFETSQVSEQEFRVNVCQLLGVELEDTAFDEIWNSMLKRLPASRMNLLEQFGEKKHTFVLSNSNIIHERKFNQMIAEVTGGSSLHDFVEKCFFSQDIGMRKPDLACYQYVVDDIGIPAEKLLFLDDRKDNVEAAIEAGLKAWQITNADDQLNTLLGWIKN